MRAFLLTAVLLAACSRQAADPPPAPVAVLAPTLSSPQPLPSVRLPAPAEPAKPAKPERDPHSIVLPRRFVMQASGAVMPMSLLPGRLPDAAHPAGTAIVTEVLADESASTISEWDLTTGTAERRVELPLPPEATNVQAIRSNDAIHVVASEYNAALYYVQLTSNLEVVAKHRLGMVTPLGPNAIATDGTLTVILADGVLDDDGPDGGAGGLFAVSFDAAGRRISGRLLDSASSTSALLSRNLTIASGAPYVVLADRNWKLRVEELSPSLKTIRRAPLALPRGTLGTSAALAQDDGHIVVDLGKKTEPITLTLDLAHASTAPRHEIRAFQGRDECGVPVGIGSVQAGLCACGKDTCLEWAAAP